MAENINNIKSEIDSNMAVRWDAGDINCEVDGNPIQLWTGSGNMFQVTWNGTNVQVSADAKGQGIELVNHNGTGTITLNISREDPLSHAIEDGQPNTGTGANLSAHLIIITTTNEQISSNNARLTKMPNIAGGPSAPNWSPAFTCVNVKAHANEHMSEPITPYEE